MVSTIYMHPTVAVSWAVTQCSVVVGHQRFRGSCCFHLQGKDGGSSVDNLPQHYTVSISRRPRLETKWCDCKIFSHIRHETNKRNLTKLFNNFILVPSELAAEDSQPYYK